MQQPSLLSVTHDHEPHHLARSVPAGYPGGSKRSMIRLAPVGVTGVWHPVVVKGYYAAPWGQELHEVVTGRVDGCAVGLHQANGTPHDSNNDGRTSEAS
jgi:hypothetical protein